MCFGSSRKEAYDSPPRRRVSYGQYTHNKDHEATEKKKNR